jgi:hypothetical protein
MLHGYPEDGYTRALVIALARRIEAEGKNANLRALVEELADDLEVEVRGRWGYDERLAHKLRRDMDVVLRARAALETDNG